MSDKVKTQHPSYGPAKKRRAIYTDVCSGTLRLRDKKETYLPQFPSETSDSYDYRLKVATLFNMTAKTAEVMNGLVFANKITLGDDVPDALEELAGNFDNRGNSLNTFASQAFDKQMEGHAVLLVDSSAMAAGSLAEEQQIKKRPYCTLYDANSVINWHFAFNPVTEAQELVLLVLQESGYEIDGFEGKEVTRYRVYRKEASSVSWELYEERDKEGDKSEIVSVDTGTIELDDIPATFIYGLKTGDGESHPPLLDMTFKNIEHYQTYSDYKSLIHKTNVPMFYTVNMTGEEPNSIGGDIHWELGEGGEAGWAEVEGTALSGTRSALEDLKIEMGQLGLSMLAAKPGGDITATEALLSSVQETSQLQKIALSLKAGIERSLSFMAQFLNIGDEGGTIELGAKWAEIVMSNEQLAELSRMVTDGNLSLESFLYTMEKAGNLPPNETAKTEAARIIANPNSGTVGRILDTNAVNALQGALDDQ